MKKMVFLSACLMFAIAAFAEPTVSDVRARQRYPWNGMVDIDYTITGDASGCKLDVIVEDKQTGKRYVPTKFLSTKSVSAGRHRLTWSTEAEGVSIVSTNVSFTLALASKASETVTNNLYYVIDLSAGPTATSYPVSTLSDVPNGEWSDTYKTTKLVLRRIEAGCIPTRNAQITRPFYIGVFEVTQKQYELITGINPSVSYRSIGDAVPVNNVSYCGIRGDAQGASWPASTKVDDSSFVGILRIRTGLDVDLPTEAQWEYACRAGTTSKYGNGGDSDSDLKILGRYEENCNDGRGGYSQLTVVGSYSPNAWGIFDMHGNVSEMCRDWYVDQEYMFGDDPVGSPSGGDRVMRGGDYRSSAYRCTSSRRDQCSPGIAWDAGGFRIVCAAGK